ncbi:GNAT family N-acetyltransferase [Micromonospora fiedleri]|uniref:GNAT family N-acetyltransferase n=1 Tax=Micromonospora fiedleri TaxID=1157498 RepID=A0ABS1UMR2_9ACTN|nr:MULTISPECIES: GNAT family N-acetyltransferase [Micromonospora]MBL6277639.1 GNAT family N-acetyltransferase [Micromonospora fiedleri]WSK42458.1 GNAT family N-acetyltransferase [Micromonospora maris]
MLGEQDLGHRIVVRRVVGTRAGRPVFSDALGELVEVTDSHLTLTTRTGQLRVPMTEIHRAKRVPPTRRPAADAVIEVELAADEAWPAPTRARLGGWLLRAADGWTGRANSALPVGDPDRPLPAALDAVEHWYADRGQPPLVTTPLPLAAPVGAELDRRGWDSRPPVLVQTVGLTALTTPPDPGAGPAVIELAGAPSDEWLAVAASRKGGLPPAAWHVLTGVDQVRFAHVYVDGALVAVGRGTVTGQGRWLGLSLIEVLPAARGQGHATALTRALSRWAEAAGATNALLQVEQHNTPAVALYRKLGFTTHHTYRTRTAPPR